MRKRALLAAATAVATSTAFGLGGAVTNASAAPQSDPKPFAAAVERAHALITDHLSALRATGNDQFLTKDVIRDADGTTHVRFDRTIGGLEVLGGDVVVHETGSGGFKGASLTLRRAAGNLSLTPRLSAAQVARGVLAEAGAPTLVIEARKGAPRLAY
ncbi:MAG TPA: peptidase M4 family protein, partial [Kribbellaceae bacterium]